EAHVLLIVARGAADRDRSGIQDRLFLLLAPGGEWRGLCRKLRRLRLRPGLAVSPGTRADPCGGCRKAIDSLRSLCPQPGGGRTPACSGSVISGVACLPASPCRSCGFSSAVMPGA